jgi:hypothetical protein
MKTNAGRRVLKRIFDLCIRETTRTPTLAHVVIARVPTSHFLIVLLEGIRYGRLLPGSSVDIVISV